MSYNTFTPIVTDGLVLCLDAVNTKSYPGTGTTWTDLSIYNRAITSDEILQNYNSMKVRFI